MNPRALSFLGLLLFYMVGPTPAMGGAAYGDVLLIVFAACYVATVRVHINARVLVLLIVPAFAVALSILGKLSVGSGAGREEMNNFLRVCSLGLIGVLAMSLALSDDPDAPGFRRSLPRVAALAIAITGLFGLVQYVRPDLFADLAGGLYVRELRSDVSNLAQVEVSGRISSFFTSANAFAEFLVFCLAVLVVNRHRVSRVLFGAAFVLGGTCIVLTTSREALVLGGIMFVYVAVIERRYMLFASVLLTAAIVASVLPIAALVGSQGAIRFSELGEFIRTGTVPWDVQIRLITLGYLPSKILHSQYALFGFPMSVYQQTVYLSWDNQYLGFLVQYGLSGILVVLWQWSWMPLCVLHLRRCPPGHATRALVHTVLLLNILIAVGGISADTLFVERWREFYFALLGATMAYSYSLRSPRPAPDGDVVAVGRQDPPTGHWEP